MNRKKRAQIFQILAAANPSPTTELRYSTPFELLIAVMLSAQMTDKGVNRATEKLFAVANTPQAILDLGLERLEDYLRSINFYRAKCRHVLQTCEILVRQHNGEVPANRQALEALPGVGRKTANVILNTAFGQPAMAVDTHIFRVANRTGIAPGKTVREVEDKLVRLVPREFLLNAHHWLILHGRYVCQARKPYCSVCRIESLCEYKAKNFDPIPPAQLRQIEALGHLKENHDVQPQP